MKIKHLISRLEEMDPEMKVCSKFNNGYRNNSMVSTARVVSVPSVNHYYDCPEEEDLEDQEEICVII